MLLKYTLFWFPLPLIFIANGTLRQFGYGSLMTELAAHQISTFIGLVLLSLYVLILEKIRPLESSSQALSVGSLWLLMTVAFEFIFGHYVVGHSWDALMHDYNLVAGRVWILVLLWTALSPWAAFKLVGNSSSLISRN